MKGVQMKIGKRIHQLRKEKDMTLEELSEKSGVALATLSRMENNKMTGTLKSHNSICKALGASIAELYKEAEDESKTVEAVPRGKRTEHFVHAKKAKYLAKDDDLASINKDLIKSGGLAALILALELMLYLSWR